MRCSITSSANNHAVRSDHLAVWAGVRHLVVCLWGGPILKVGHTPTSVEQVSRELLVSYGCVLTPCLFLPFERCKFFTWRKRHMNLHPKHVARVKFILLVVSRSKRMSVVLLELFFRSVLGTRVLVLLPVCKDEVICTFICYDLLFI